MGAGGLTSAAGALSLRGKQQGPARGASSQAGPAEDTSESLRLQFTTDRWTDLKNAYIVYHQACWQALLFYANQSWIDWDDARKVWYPLTPSDDWVPRPRINRFSPTIDAITSNIYQIPEVESVANPLDDPDSNMISEIANKLAASFVDTQGLKRQKDTQEDKAGLAGQLFAMLGTVFTIFDVVSKNVGSRPRMSSQQTMAYTCEACDQYRVVPVGGEVPKFCPECGNPVDAEPAETMAAEEGPDGQPATDEISEYSIELHIGNPLWAFPRAGAKSLEDQNNFLLWAERDTLDHIYFMFDKFPAEPDAEWPDGYSVTYEHALNFWYTGYSSSTMQVKDSCLVKRMYVEPNKVKDHPEGFYHVEINGKTAHNEDWQFPAHPITMFKYLNLPTIFFGRSVGFDLVELQRELNAYESVIKLHSMVAAVDPIIVDAGTIVSEITGRSDKVIKWRSIGPNSEPPHRMGAGHLDDGIYKQRDNLHAEFQNVSMAVNAFRGQQEGAITASSAISQLRGQAELMFSKPVSGWNNGWCETIRKAVKYMQFYYTLEQLASIVGPGKESEIQKFKSADLDKTTEWIPSTHGLPKTRDERRQEMLTLWDKGALDIQQPSVRKEIYELFGNTGMMQSFNKDATNARLENTAIKNGAGWLAPAAAMVPEPGQADAMAQPQPMPGPDGQVHPAITPMLGIEDLAVHLYFHKDQVKSTDFKKWPPPAQQALIVHTLDTDKALKLEMMQQMSMQAAGAGKGPGAGAGSGGAAGGKPKDPKSQAQSNGAEGAKAQESGGSDDT